MKLTKSQLREIIKEEILNESVKLKDLFSWGKPITYPEYGIIELKDKLTIDDIKKNHKWLLAAKIKKAIIGIKGNTIIWYDGYWQSGAWKNGIWKDGIWQVGTFENGIWEDGTWEEGTWKNGTWKDGIWESGVWHNGIWENGMWQDGWWKNGTWKGGGWLDGIWDGGKWKSSTKRPREYTLK